MWKMTLAQTHQIKTKQKKPSILTNWVKLKISVYMIKQSLNTDHKEKAMTKNKSLSCNLESCFISGVHFLMNLNKIIL